MLTQQKARCEAERSLQRYTWASDTFALGMFLVSSAHIANSGIAVPALCL